MTKSVLIIGNFLSSSGLNQTVCEELAAKLQAVGWSVTTTSDKLQRLPRLLDMLLTIWKARRTYKIAQIDVFSGAAFLWAEASAWLLKRLDKPYILTLHGGALPEFAAQKPQRVRNLLLSAQVVTTPSGFLYEKMRSYRSDLYLLNNPIELAAYQHHLRDKPQPQLMWLRAFHDIYNPVMAVEVMAALQDEFPQVHLTMVGPDKDGTLAQVQAKADALNVRERLTTPGRVNKDEVPAWMNKGDIFLNTTDIDNAPVSIIEAMACGLCVVSTNVGGIPYLLEHEVNALLVPPRDPQAMTDAVRRILTDAELAARLSRNAQATAEGFSWTNILPQWEKLLTEYQN